MLVRVDLHPYRKRIDLLSLEATEKSGVYSIKNDTEGLSFQGQQETIQLFEELCRMFLHIIQRH